MSARVFFAGAVAGAIVGGLAVVALQRESATLPVAENAPAASVPEETTARADSSPARAPVHAVQSAADVSVPAAPVPARVADVATTSDPADELFRMDAAKRSRGESIEQLADKMKTEPRDDAWASNMENELRDYLARRPVPNALGSTSVDCRATVCRILSVVSDAVFAAVPMTDLQAALAALPDESLGRELAVPSIAVMADSKQPGQMIEVALLRRADQSSNSRQR